MIFIYMQVRHVRIQLQIGNVAFCGWRGTGESGEIPPTRIKETFVRAGPLQHYAKSDPHRHAQTENKGERLSPQPDRRVPQCNFPFTDYLPASIRRKRNTSSSLQENVPRHISLLSDISGCQPYREAGVNKFKGEHAITFTLVNTTDYFYLFGGSARNTLCSF